MLSDVTAVMPRTLAKLVAGSDRFGEDLHSVQGFSHNTQYQGGGFPVDEYFNLPNHGGINTWLCSENVCEYMQHKYLSEVVGFFKRPCDLMMGALSLSPRMIS